MYLPPRNVIKVPSHVYHSALLPKKERDNESPLYNFNLATSSSSTSSSFVGSEFRFFSPSSPGIPLIPEDKPSYYESIFLPVSSSWTYPPSTTPSPPMIVEEGVAKNGRPVTPRSIANSLDSLSECAQHHSDVVNANSNSANGDRSRSLGDLLSATNQDGTDAMRNGSYDTLVSKGGGLTDSGIGAGLMMGMRDEMEMEDNDVSLSSPDRIPTDISSPDSFSYPAVSFASYDPVVAGSVYSNENTNPLDSSSPSRGHSSDDRKYTELPAISEESEHEQSIHIPYNYPVQTPPPHASSVGPLPSAVDRHREVVEHTYPMVHCKSAPSTNAFNNIEHRRVVSDDVTEITRLKRSEEMENIDKTGRISVGRSFKGFRRKMYNLQFEKRSSSTHNLKKPRSKSAMIVFQGDPEENSKDEEDVDGYSKDNDMLILDRSGVDRSAKNPLRHYDNHSNLPSISTEPPPVRIHRKVSAASSSSRVSPYKASDQSWKDKMPPFGMVGHTMYSPQSLPTRDAIPRSPFDGSGTVSAGGSQRLISLEVTTPDGRGDTESTDNYSTPLRTRTFHHHHHYHSIPSPPALLATNEVSEVLMPLSEICNQNRFSTISSSTNTDSSPPKSATPNSSFVRRSLRKIMKRSSVSASTLNVGVVDDGGGLRNGSLKRRASNVSTGFFASAQAHLKPRPKSLKKQSWMCTSMLLGGMVTTSSPSSSGGEESDAYFPSASLSSLSQSSSIAKSNKKEKTGSDTFTFGNLFRKKVSPCPFTVPVNKMYKNMIFSRFSAIFRSLELAEKLETFKKFYESKPTASRPNLADIISDLDQRSTRGGGSLSVGATNRRSTSATILPMSGGGGPNDPTTPFDSSSLDGNMSSLSAAALVARRARRKFSTADVGGEMESSSSGNNSSPFSTVYQNIFAQHLTICTTRDRRATAVKHVYSIP
ncbi:Protein CBG19792 [Caenorhabditis briggsae]|uniref:Protein CBG19792 n=1 Tax=Caenorhabditis briggsae TaxID=6238 RepID=A8XWA8_CAEBR|nr:Protein CBG19792 [Caenorhabditis briggsae]CAP36927.2 Protein CBG19792 [Caenorhabditis briggsae]